MCVSMVIVAMNWTDVAAQPSVGGGSWVSSLNASHTCNVSSQVHELQVVLLVSTMLSSAQDSHSHKKTNVA